MTNVGSAKNAYVVSFCVDTLANFVPNPKPMFKQIGMSPGKGLKLAHAARLAADADLRGF
ncbi:hypothetical protein LWF01_17895 [Saxibacter everestensis]|uniref:Uncharacterized protein n=1 Tax=Saxibacter everestensis TaxID=2909229 RepID=A0ABY8QUG0_9MICO|nr:hypothetical protein LWF01_17895 [Brevibacteriaceae bacterium ZFBP1038]